MRHRIVGSIAVAACAAMLSTCSTGLLDLVAFEVLWNEPAMLYLGYRAEGFGVARVGTTSGALEIFRRTVSPDNHNGCAMGISSEAMPQIYYAAEAPNRIAKPNYSGLSTPVDVFLTDPQEKPNCVRLVQWGWPIYFSTTRTIYNCAIDGAYLTPLAQPVVFYVSSFDIDDATARIYWLGLSDSEGESGFGIDGINQDGSSHVSLVTLGQYTMSNLLVEGGYIYYVTQEPYALLRIKADGSELTPTTLLTPVAKPYAIAVDPADGTLYWVEHEDNEMARIMRAAPGETAGVPLVEYLPDLDPNGFFFYRP